MEFISEFFANGDFWSVLIKVLLTAILTGLLGLIGTGLGKIIANCKNSKIRRYAKICVEAAEQKFPNEGKKMGPEKMQYVMDQMMIRFPKIRDNQYLYNIAEAAVFQLNIEFQKEAAVKEFEKKYGEKPLAIADNKSEIPSGEQYNQEVIEKEEVNEVKNENIASNQIPKNTINKNQNRLKSF